MTLHELDDLLVDLEYDMALGADNEEIAAALDMIEAEIAWRTAEAGGHV